MRKHTLDAVIHAVTGPLSQNMRGMKAAKPNKQEPRNESIQKTIVAMRAASEFLGRLESAGSGARAFSFSLGSVLF